MNLNFIFFWGWRDQAQHQSQMQSVSCCQFNPFLLKTKLCFLHIISHSLRHFWVSLYHLLLPKLTTSPISLGRNHDTPSASHWWEAEVDKQKPGWCLNCGLLLLLLLEMLVRRNLDCFSCLSASAFVGGGPSGKWIMCPLIGLRKNLILHPLKWGSMGLYGSITINEVFYL